MHIIKSVKIKRRYWKTAYHLNRGERQFVNANSE